MPTTELAVETTGISKIPRNDNTPTIKAAAGSTLDATAISKVTKKDSSATIKATVANQVTTDNSGEKTDFARGELTYVENNTESSDTKNELINRGTATSVGSIL